MNIEKFLVKKGESLLEIMKKIDLNSYGIVFVEENKKLIGVITDGDIRRHILSNSTLDSTAQQIMNKQPNYSYTLDEKANKKLLKEKRIKVLPIVTDDKEIIDIQTIDIYETESKIELNIPVVIMAGGKGTRLYPYTQILPKPLIPINDKTIAEIILDEFKKYGCKNNYMIVNYKKELIKAFFYEATENHDLKFIEEKNFLGTAGGLKLLKPYISTTFFLNNCDILIKENYGEILKYHREHKNIITLVCALKKEIIPYGTVKTDENGQLLELTEKPNFDFLINTGLYIIEPEIFDEIPEDTFIHITDVIQNCIDKKLNVGVYPVREECWMDMGQLEELENMRQRLNGK